MTKKVKRTITLILAAIMLLSTMSVLAFADNKLPTYAEATSKEVGPHDHVAPIAKEVLTVETYNKATKEVVMVNVNTVGSPKYVEDTAAYAQPTCTKGGVREFVLNCAVCGVELDRIRYDVKALSSHVPADKKTIEEVKAPTCAKEGSYLEVTRCKFCNTVLESVKVIVNKTTAHVAADPVVLPVDDATCKKVGHYYSVIYCALCGVELQKTLKEIPKLTYHISNYTQPGFRFANGKTRTCADGEERCVVCGELLNPAIPHVWDKGVTTRSATLTQQGQITYTCLIKGCGMTKTVNTPVVAPTVGDVNSDGDVTPADARLVLRYSVGLGDFDKVITGALVKIADYDKNGKVEPADARLILREAVGLPN